MRFSERHGYTELRDGLQLESMDEALRVAIWNVLDSYVLAPIAEAEQWYYVPAQDWGGTMRSLWAFHFKQPLDEFPSPIGLRASLRTWVLKSEWFRVYDLVEFFARHAPERREELVRGVNAALEREGSAYRLVTGQIVPITDESELREVEEATAAAGPAGVAEHLRAAVTLLSDRDTPDYRNSIKESISAVEALVVDLTGDTRGTLGAALKTLAPTVSIHPAMKTALSQLYGYTSDEGGIRHAMLEQSDVRFEDAKLMLVLCSAFINYLVAKAGRGGATYDG